MLVAWRARVGDQPIRFSLPAFWRRRTGCRPWREPAAVPTTQSTRRRRHSRSAPQPARCRGCSTSTSRASTCASSSLGIVSACSGIFYISTFIDLVDKLFRGETTGVMLARYFYFQTPQFVYYIIPMAVLVATLVTIGLSDEEQRAARDARLRHQPVSHRRCRCCFSASLASGVLFVMQERVLARRTARPTSSSGSSATGRRRPRALNRRWMVGTSGEIYHYDFFDPAHESVHEPVWSTSSMSRRGVFARSRARPKRSFTRRRTPIATARRWLGRQGWTREISRDATNGEDTAEVKYEPFAERDLALEPPATSRPMSRSPT